MDLLMKLEGGLVLPRFELGGLGLLPLAAAYSFSRFKVAGVNQMLNFFAKVPAYCQAHPVAQLLGRRLSENAGSK